MSLLARTSIVSAATLLSRVLGFVRDAATAAVLGAGPVADALVAALALPLLARRLLAEGAFNLAFIPALARAGADRREDAAAEAGQGRAAAEEAHRRAAAEELHHRAATGECPRDPAAGAGRAYADVRADAPARLAAATLVLLFGLLLACAVPAALFMPQLIGLLAPGFEPGGQRADVAILCGRVAVLYVPLAGLAAIYGGVANAAHRVLLPALAPVAANLTVLTVIAALIADGLMESDTAALAIAAATVAAGVAQLALMMTAARGCPGRPVFGGGLAGQLGAALGVIRAASPALLFAGLSQFRLIIVAAAVSASPGAVAALNYAQRLMDLPLGLVGASAGAVLVPALLRRGGGDAPEAAGRAVLAALGFALPAATGLTVLAEPIVTVLFQRGSFDAQDARLTGGLLAMLALSLPAQGLERILSATAATSGLVRAAERVALASLALCLAAAAGLALGVGPQAAAGAVALSALASIAALGGLLMRRGALVLSPLVLLSALGLGVASAVMGGCVAALAAVWPVPTGQIAGAVRLAALVGCGVVAYGGVGLAAKTLLARRMGPA